MLQLNDDCKMKILSYLSPIELCAVAETCTDFERIAVDVFKSQLKTSSECYYKITTDDEFQDNHRILKKFGSLISKALVHDVEGSAWKMVFAFDWLQRFCAGTLETLEIFSDKKEVVLSPSAVTLMSTLKTIVINAPIHPGNLRIALANCKELVDLYVFCTNRYEDFSFGIWNNSFPQLKRLECEWLDSDIDSNQIETFLQNHTELTCLRLCFYQYRDNGTNRIDLSFLKNLQHLEELELQLDFSNVERIDALSHLQNLKVFVLSDRDVETCSAILNSVAAVHSMKTLVFLIFGDRFRDISDVRKVFESIKRLKNLSELELAVHKLDFMSLQPKEIVDVVRKLTDIKVVQLNCDFKSKLDESIFVELAKVCSSQQRQITLCINAGRVDDLHRQFFEKFNKNHQSVVEIKVQREKFNWFFGE